MRVGIIGAGNIGGNLARRLTATGHEVAIANSRGPETLAALAEETGATPLTAATAANGAGVVIVTIPLAKVAELPGDLLAGAAPGAVVIDTNNYYPGRDGRIGAIEDDGSTESEWVQVQLGAPVVKAFNGIYAAKIVDAAKPAGAEGRLALPISGDDDAAKATVAALIDDIGFDVVDDGPIAQSWRQQPGSPSYGAAVGAEELRELLAAASPERPAEFRG